VYECSPAAGARRSPRPCFVALPAGAVASWERAPVRGACPAGDGAEGPGKMSVAFYRRGCGAATGPPLRSGGRSRGARCFGRQGVGEWASGGAGERRGKWQAESGRGVPPCLPWLRVLERAAQSRMPPAHTSAAPEGPGGSPLVRVLIQPEQGAEDRALLAHEVEQHALILRLHVPQPDAEQADRSATSRQTSAHASRASAVAWA